jgi:hypothetical protein
MHFCSSVWIGCWCIQQMYVTGIRNLPGVRLLDAPSRELHVVCLWMQVCCAPKLFILMACGSVDVTLEILHVYPSSYFIEQFLCNIVSKFVFAGCC